MLVPSTLYGHGRVPLWTAQFIGNNRIVEIYTSDEELSEITRLTESPADCKKRSLLGILDFAAFSLLTSWN